MEKLAVFYGSAVAPDRAERALLHTCQLRCSGLLFEMISKVIVDTISRRAATKQFREQMPYNHHERNCLGEVRNTDKSWIEIPGD
jgi:hypothetical protein